MRIRRVLVPGVSAVLFAALAFACSARDASESVARVTVRDSAGVQILTYPPGDFSDTISPVPLLTIGQEGEPDYEFFRLGTAASLASGNVVVANGGTHELRFYGPDGEHVRTVGRRGGGPAEFGFLSTLWVRPGDTLAVLDPNRRRVVFFDSAGTLVRGDSYAGDLTDQQPESAGPCVFPGLMGLLGDGARVTSEWGCMMFQGRDGKRPTALPVEIVRPEGRENVDIFTAMWVWERASPANPRDLYSPIPFLGRFVFAIGQDRIYISEGMDLEIKIFDAHGRHVGLLREDTVPPRVTDADRDAYVEEQAATPRPLPADVPFPDRFGSYSELLLSFEGDLWARRYPRPGDEVQYWVVFPQGGQEARRVVMPDLSVRSVRDGRIYGHRSDTLGIQTVIVLDAGH
jgi:hypothetical protein